MAHMQLVIMRLLVVTCVAAVWASLGVAQPPLVPGSRPAMAGAAGPLLLIAMTAFIMF